MKLENLTKKFKKNIKWKFSAPKGVPHIPKGLSELSISFPSDYLKFWELCGGLDYKFEKDEDLCLSVLSPSESGWAVGEIFSGFGYVTGMFPHKNEYTWYWYLIGRGDTDDYYLMDLAPERLGYCYFANFYFFGHPHHTSLVSYNFQDFLIEIYRAGEMGEEWLELIEEGEKLASILA
ncbi:MAG: SMI1/KNR4 family protein [Chloroflexota bacterium]